MQIPVFLKKISILLIGSGFAQALNIVFTSFLTRLYLPEQFGAQVVFITIAFYFSVVFTGKYELALVIPHEDSKARSLATLSVKLLLGLSVLFIPAFYFFGDNLAHLFNQSEMAAVSWLIPLSIVALGFSSIFNYWNTRQENYKVLSAVRIAETALTGVLALVFFKLTVHGLILSSLAGTAITSLILYIIFLKDPHKTDAGRHKDAEIAKEYIDFPKNNIAISLIGAFQFMGITLLISYFFNPEIAGYFALCNRILQAPIGLIIKPISQVYFAESSKLFREKRQIYPITLATIKRTGLIALPFLAILLIGGPFLFSLVFGAKWYVSGFYAQILVLWFYLEFIKAPVSQLAVIVRKQKKMLQLNFILLLLFVVPPFFLHYLSSDPVVFLIYTSVFNIISCLYFLFWFVQLAKKYDEALELESTR